MTVLIGASAGALVATLTAFLMLAPQRRANRQIALAQAQLALAQLTLEPRTCTVCHAVTCDTCHECERQAKRARRPVDGEKIVAERLYSLGTDRAVALASEIERGRRTDLRATTDTPEERAP